MGHDIGFQALTNVPVAMDEWSPLGTDLPTSALQRFRPEAMGQLTFG
jgi:hypothetical protein